MFAHVIRIVKRSKVTIIIYIGKINLQSGGEFKNYALLFIKSRTSFHNCSLVRNFFVSLRADMETTQRYDREDLLAAVRVLSEGGVIIYPTDTVWGIGCDATNESAVERVFQIKRRADSKQMLCLVDSAGRLQQYVRELPAMTWQLLDYATRPMTIIYPDVTGLARGLVAEDGSAGIRITSELFSHALCERFKKPIVSTSANFSGEKTPACFQQISKELLAEADYVVRFRRSDLTPAQPSSVIKLGPDNLVKVIRQ